MESDYIIRLQSNIVLGDSRGIKAIPGIETSIRLLGYLYAIKHDEQFL